MFFESDTFPLQIYAGNMCTYILIFGLNFFRIFQRVGFFTFVAIHVGHPVVCNMVSFHLHTICNISPTLSILQKIRQLLQVTSKLK